MAKAPTPPKVKEKSPTTIREKATGASAVIRSLEELGVKSVFGLPGGAALPLYDAIFQSPKIRHILVRHEQGAGHAAEGLAVSTGEVGVCIATSGPGASNLVANILAPVVAATTSTSPTMPSCKRSSPSCRTRWIAWAALVLYPLVELLPALPHGITATRCNFIQPQKAV